MATVELNAGTIHYETSGPTTGRPVVFVHGYAMGSSLWGPLRQRLGARGLQCIAPTWPLGAQTQAVGDGDNLTMEGVAAMVAELLETLRLENVVLVGNDTGGAIAQIVATSCSDRLGALVLTSCDAFENFPPPILKPLIVAASWPFTFGGALQLLRTRFGRTHAYGKLAHADIEHLAAQWVKPALNDQAIRENLRHFTASLDDQSMVEPGERLAQFTRPALVAWSSDDAFFPLDDGRRLAAVLPNSRLEVVQAARTFSMIDQPDVLAGLIAGFAGA